MQDEGVVCVVGWAPWTPVGLDKDAAGNPLWQGTGEGDSRVLYVSALTDTLPAWYVEKSHGELIRHSAVFGGLSELLGQGRTQSLSGQKPLRASSSLVAPPQETPSLFPGEEDLVAAALGFSLAGPRTKRFPTST